VTITVERGPRLTVLTIDIPPLNLFTVAVLDELVARLHGLLLKPPRALLLRGAGDLMSGGVDVSDFQGATVAAFEQSCARWLEDNVTALEALPCPTIAACHGLCLTAAFELALACDRIVATRSAQFGLVEASLGLTPAMGGTARLLLRAGRGSGADAAGAGTRAAGSGGRPGARHTRTRPTGPGAGARTTRSSGRGTTGPRFGTAAARSGRSGCRRGRRGDAGRRRDGGGDGRSRRVLVVVA
jgi:Enoyl-CoA hydratase/isomerase